MNFSYFWGFSCLKIMLLIVWCRCTRYDFLLVEILIFVVKTWVYKDQKSFIIQIARIHINDLNRNISYWIFFKGLFDFTLLCSFHLWFVLRDNFSLIPVSTLNTAFVVQTALMQACLYGHWKVVQILVLFKANVSEHQLFLVFLLSQN
jgi:hypothetical protein